MILVHYPQVSIELSLFADNSGDQSAPEFLKSLSDLEVIEGQFVKFKVKVKGYPQPRVQWFKDGKKIKADDQFRFGKSRHYGKNLNDWQVQWMFPILLSQLC